MKRHPFSRLLALLLAAVLVLGDLPAASAAPVLRLEKADVDVTFDRSDRLIPESGGSDTERNTEPVRVAIVLEDKSTAEAGYSTHAIASNPQALAYNEALERSQKLMARSISEQALAGQALDVVWNLTLVTNLISANVPYEAIDAIRAVDGVREVVIERQYSPDTAEPQMESASSMVGASAVWDSGYTGAGSRVAIVDTGTDTDHQSFDNGAYLHALAQNAKDQDMSYEAYVRSLDLMDIGSVNKVLRQLNVTERIGYDDASSYYISEKLPFAANYVDCNLTVDHDSDNQGSHGSHVAGIAAANRYIPSGGGYVDAMQSVHMTGVAPDAQIVTMKVFGNGDGPFDSDFFAAIEDAILLGCDSVNLSLGSGDPGTSSNELFADLLDFLATTDTVVVISAGNSGHWAERTQSGYLYHDGVSFQTAGSPGTYTNSLAVASVDNDGAVGSYFTVGDRMVVYTESPNFRNRTMSSMDYATDGTGTSYDYLFIDGLGAASDYDGMDLKNKVVFCSRGGSSFSEKANAAARLGAAAVVICNNTSGAIAMDLSEYLYTVPCVSITQKEAALIRGASKASTTAAGVTYYTGAMTIHKDLGAASYDSDYYTMSDFSSWGVPGSLELKPEITAPGGRIWSVNGVDTSGSAYELMSGTSMAAPQVTGMVALAAEYIRANGLEAKTGLSVRHLAQSLLMSTAEPLFEEAAGCYYSVLNQGAGLARVDRAVSAESYILVEGMADGKVKVELGEDPARTGVYPFSFTIHNLTDRAMTYDLRADLFTQDVFDGGSGTLYLGTQTRMLGSTARFTCNGVSLEDGTAGFSCDLNGDGVTNSADADHLLEYLVGNVSKLHANGDVSGDGKVNSYDAHLLLTKGAGTYAVTVRAGSSVTVDVKLELTDDTRAFLAEHHPAGAYLEGFVFAQPDEGVAHSIPVLGYYGSWTEPGMYDVGGYVEHLSGAETRAPYLYAINENQSNFVSIDYGDGDEYLFGGNPIVDEAQYLPRRNGFNNQSGYVLRNLRYTLIRNAAYTALLLTDADTGKVYWKQELGGKTGAYYHTNSGAWINAQSRLGLGLDLAGIPEGTNLELSLVAAPELYVTDGTVDLNALGDGARLTTRLTIDNTAPRLQGYTLEGNTLTVTAKDNQYIAAVALLNEAGTSILTAVPGNQTSPNTTLTAKLDVSQVYGSKFLIAVYDYAENVTTYAAELDLQNQRPRFTAINSTDVNDQGALDYVGLSADGSFVTLASAAGRKSAQAAEYVDGWVFEISEDNRLYVGADSDLFTFRELGALDPDNTWQIVTFNDLAYDSAGGKLYGCFYSDLNDQNMPYLCSIDLYTGAMEVLGELPVDINAMTIDDAGNFYGTVYGSGALCTFLADVISTKKYTKIATLSGYGTRDRNSMAWDHDTDELYWAASHSSGSTLLKVDPRTGSASHVSTFPFVCVGLYIAPETVGDTFAPTDQVLSISLPGTAAALAGSTVRLQAKVLPWNVSDASVTWSSSNTAVATVDSDGLVTGVRAGTAVITAASKLDRTRKASCTVTVSALDQPLNALIGDGESQVWWSEFDPAGLPAYTKLAQVEGDLPLVTTAAADGVLYAGTIDTSTGVSDLYKVDPDTYAVEKVGGSDVIFYADLAWAPNLGCLIACYGGYLCLVDPATGEYLGAFDWSGGSAGDLMGITWIGSEYHSQSGSMMDVFLLLDTEGNVYRECLYQNGTYYYVYGPEAGALVNLGEPVDTAFFQGFHFDGTYVYWTRFSEAEDAVELIVWDVLGSGNVYPMGRFPQRVWPVGGLYTDGDVAASNALTAPCAAAELRGAAMEQCIVQLPGEQAPAGGLHGAAGLLSSGTMDGDGKLTLSVTLPAAAPSGVMELTYDPKLLELTGVKGDTDAFAWAPGSGGVKLAFAAAEELDAEARVAELTFTALRDGGAEVVVQTLELGGEPGGSSQTISLELVHRCPSAQFVDVPQSKWFHSSVDYVVEKGYMVGMDPTRFGPNISINRAQFLTVLWRMAGSPEVPLTDQFTDVEPERYYTKAVAWAVACGVTYGITDTTFCPYKVLTRAQLVTFMYRYAGLQGCDTSISADLSGYTDGKDVPKFAREAFCWALSHGMIYGVTATTLAPGGNATRAQAAAIFQRYDLNLAT